jgi:hypothetical protein
MEQNMQSPQSQPQPQSQKSGGSKIGCWIAGCLTAIVVFVLFVVGLIAIGFIATRGPVKVVEEQLVYLRRGDIEGAYLLTSLEFRKATNLDGFKNFVARHASLAQNKKVSFSNREIKNNIGVVEGTLTGVDGLQSPVHYQLVKENEAWKVLYIEFPGKSDDVAQPAKAVQSNTPQKKDVPSGTSIANIEVGTQRAPDGSISDANTRFSSGIGDVKISVYLSGAKKGQNINAMWFFGGEQITDPVINVMEEDGDFISQFYLGRPANGWPAGMYKIVVYIDGTNIAKELTYTIQ